jgi:hypothetical protein
MQHRKKEGDRMQTIRVLEKTGKDGSLHLNIPVGKPESEFEVVVVLQPIDVSVKIAAARERGWPSGYFESTYGSIQDETFTRPPQGEMPKSVDLG